MYVLDAQHRNGKAYPMAWIFIGTEISVAVPLFVQTVWNVFILKRRKRSQLRLEGEDVPSVDVFITCCKEEVDVIMDTTRAACEIDWPVEKFRVIVLDDGGDIMLREAVQNLGHVYPNLWYRARTKIPGVPHHFKAGNLNYGLEEVHNMPGGAARFMAALDADMIPERHWLRALVPHLLIDDKMAMACPPQVRRSPLPSIESANNRHSSSTTFLGATRSLKVWISSCTSASQSKTRSAWHGAQDPATFSDARLLTTSAASPKAPLRKMSLRRLICSAEDGVLRIFTSPSNSVLCRKAMAAI